MEQEARGSLSKLPVFFHKNAQTFLRRRRRTACADTSTALEHISAPFIILTVHSAVSVRFKGLFTILIKGLKNSLFIVKHQQMFIKWKTNEMKYSCDKSISSNCEEKKTKQYVKVFTFQERKFNNYGKFK